MSKSKRNWEPLDGLNKSELEELRLKTEIIKLRHEVEEKSKSWISKNLGILIPSFLAFLTLLTGYFTGFFSVEAKRLEIKRDILGKDVQDFTAKKDSLNKTNIELNKENNFLIATKTDLEHERRNLVSDTLELHGHLLSINRRLKEIEREKNRLGNDITSLNREKTHLEEQKNALDVKVQKINSDLSKAGFTVLWNNFKVAPNYFVFGKTLRDTIEESTAFKREYISIVRNTADTTTDLSLKGVLEFFMYTLTREKSWSDKFLHTGDEICESINSGNTHGNSDYSYYWSTFGAIPYISHFSKEDKIKIADRLVGCIRKIFAHYSEVSSIMGSLRSLSDDVNYKNLIINELRMPQFFCFFVSTCQAMAYSNRHNGYGIYDMALLLQRVAPIAFSCLISELLSKPEFESTINVFQMAELKGKALTLIEKNNDIFVSEPPSSTRKSWIEWQERNQKIVTILKTYQTIVMRKLLA